ncbi:MAG: M23 family metallopeptidase [bacterium]|nr:M23 family metallopeptidase [bacterium]
MSAHAGFFSDIVDFFSGSETGEEASLLSSPFIQELEAAEPPESSFAQKNELPAGGKPDVPALVLLQESALVAPSNPLGRIEDGIGGSDLIYLYTVSEGDTLSSIARRFQVSVNTILWANEIKNSRSIKAGDKLVILPVTGIQYEVKKGDTISTIAKKYKGNEEDILAFNGLLPGDSLEAGSEIIIPDGEIQIQIVAPSSAPSYIGRLPEIFGYYMRPIAGGRNPRVTKKNPQGIHGNNGVDIAIACGTSIVASAQGTVIVARSSGWNGGYGRYVVIAHPNGTQTLYGHDSRVLVSVGQSVAQGQQIATVGSTGNSTGCHVHFEVRGAKNPVW